MQLFILRFRTFAHRHDDIPAFHAAYLVGALLAAAIFHLGFFAILVAAHMCLDYVKYRDFFHYDLRTTFKAMALESVVDIAFFLLSLTFAVYLHHSFGLAAASGLIRSELTILRAIGTLLPKIAILEHFTMIALNFHSYLFTPHPDIHKPLHRTHAIALGVIGVCTLLLLGAVLLYQRDEIKLLTILVDELSIRL